MNITKSRWTYFYSYNKLNAFNKGIKAQLCVMTTAINKIGKTKFVGEEDWRDEKKMSKKIRNYEIKDW